eukprot:1201116-Lingulodinium_polyedra.AAC.1
MPMPRQTWTLVNLLPGFGTFGGILRVKTRGLNCVQKPAGAGNGECVCTHAQSAQTSSPFNPDIRVNESLFTGTACTD